jgi:sodium-dependent phosphate cotransporter
VIQNIALGSNESDLSLVKRYCSYQNITNENGTSILIPENYCQFLFSKISWPDWGIGLLLLVLSLTSLCTCLVLLVKLLQTMLKGTISTVIHKTVNADFPGIFRHLTPYLAIGVNIRISSKKKFCFFHLGWLYIYNTRSK